MGYVLGVDIGTTYTAAAVDVDGRSDIFQLGSHAASVPSVVVLRTDGEILTGEAAERRAQAEPARAVREFKRRLGDPVPVLLGGTPYGAESLYAHMLRSVYDQVRGQRGQPPDLVVVTHPASYGPYKLDLLRQAIRQAEVGESVLLSEPEAAAIHYAHQERVEPGAVVAVYDLGGGTFDAAVLRNRADVFEVIGQPEGLERLGGIDFDQAVQATVNAATGGVLDRLDQQDPKVRAAAHRLREECRVTKEALSSDTEGVIAVLLPDLQTEVRITRGEFEENVRPRLKETLASLQRAVHSAGLEFGDVDRILLVGGSSRIPLVGAMIRESTGRPTAIDAHPKHAIALGAAIYGRARLESTGVAKSERTPAEREVIDGPAYQQPGTQEPASPLLALAGTKPRQEFVPGSLVNGRRKLAAGAGFTALSAAVAAAIWFGGRGDREGTARASLAAPAEVSRTSTPVPSLVETATALATPTPVPVTESPPTSAAYASVAPTATPTRAASATPSIAPATAAPKPPTALITGVKVVSDRYEVTFSTAEFVPAIPGMHVHFYFNGASGADGFDYAGVSPFTGYRVAERPGGASQICIVVAAATHTVVAGSGNCVNLPNY